MIDFAKFSLYEHKVKEDITEKLIELFNTKLREKNYIYKTAQEWAEELNKEFEGKPFNAINFGKFVKKNLPEIQKHFDVAYYRKKNGRYWIISKKEKGGDVAWMSKNFGRNKTEDKHRIESLNLK